METGNYVIVAIYLMVVVEIVILAYQLVQVQRLNVEKCKLNKKAKALIKRSSRNRGKMLAVFQGQCEVDFINAVRDHSSKYLDFTELETIIIKRTASQLGWGKWPPVSSNVVHLHAPRTR